MLIDTAPGTALKAKLFRGLADSSRLSLLDLLRSGPRTVGALVEATGLTQSNVSNHLGCLRDCGLVTSAQQGRYVLYQLSDERVEMLLALADEVLREVARGVEACANYIEAPPPLAVKGADDEPYRS
jgi:ArsR family transcriptional regulator, cadmium/lead-responsive transcriptional repressor